MSSQTRFTPNMRRASGRNTRPVRTPRRNRGTRSNRLHESDDEVRVIDPPEPCIDLTSTPDPYIDLTRSHGVLDDSPVVVLTPADDIGPTRRRRGSGRRGRRRANSSNRQPPQRSSNSVVDLSSTTVDQAPQVHVFIWDNSDGEDLPEVPFQIPPASSSANASLLKSPEGIKISCPVCMDDIKQIKRTRRQVMSTVCGHIFCDECIRNAISIQHACPTCRKLLNLRSIHPIFL